MTTLFNRNIKLAIYTKTKVITIKELYVSFDILLRQSEKPNTGKITVYNLSETTRNILQGEYLFCEFSASYSTDEPFKIFQGEIVNILSFKNGADWVTEIYAGDGLKSFDTTYFNKTFSAGTSLQSILNEIASSMGLPIHIGIDTQKTIAGVVLNKARTLEGTAKKAMTDFLKDFGLLWSVQFGVVEITTPGESIGFNYQIVNINKDSGLIGTPSISWKKEKKKKTEVFTSSVSFQTLMIPQIKPNTLINIQSQYFKLNYGALSEDKIKNVNASGIYVVSKVQLTGSNFDNDFGLKVEANAK